MNNFLDFSQPISMHGGFLPHWDQKNKLQFVTFRLADSLPQSLLKDFKRRRKEWLSKHPKPWSKKVEREYLISFPLKMEKYCDANYGKCVLANESVAALVRDILENNDMFISLSYVIMPNHIHMIILPIGENILEKILQKIKGSSSYKINRYLNRSGKLWMREYFDRIIRNSKHLEKVVQYIRDNFKQGGILWKEDFSPLMYSESWEGEI